MARTPSCDKSGMRKGTWTAEEDRKLIAYVTRYGCWNWRQLPKFAGLARCGKSCRLRWMNYLRPNIKRGNFTQDEEEFIIKMHKKIGNKWSTIAAELPGRTDNEVKNHWHTSLKKRAEDNTNKNQETQTSKSKDINESTQEQDIVFFHVTPPTSSQFSDTTSPLSPFSSSSEFSSIDQSNENLVLEDEFGFLEHVDESFWKDPYLDNISNTQSGIVQGNTTNNCAFQNQDTMIHDDAFLVSPNHSYTESLVMDNNDLFGSFLESYTESTVDSFWTHPFVADMCHVPSELVTPLAMESEFFSIVYDEDLWS